MLETLIVVKAVVRDPDGLCQIFVTMDNYFTPIFPSFDEMFLHYFLFSDCLD